MWMYRAVSDCSGEIWEADNFRLVYRCGLSHAKDYAKDSGYANVRFEKVRYSDYEYLNEFGYMQRDIVERIGICSVVVRSDPAGAYGAYLFE